MQILRSLLNSGVFMVLLVVAVSVYLAYSEQIHSSLEELEVTTSPIFGQDDDRPVVVAEEVKPPMAQQETASVASVQAAAVVEQPASTSVSVEQVTEAKTPVVEKSEAAVVPQSVVNNEISWPGMPLAPMAQMPGMPEMPPLAPMAQMSGMPEMPPLAPMAQMPGMPEMPPLAPMAQMPGMSEMPPLAPMAQMPGMSEMPPLAPMAQMPEMSEMPPLAPMAQMPGMPEMPPLAPMAQMPGMPEMPPFAQMSEIPPSGPMPVMPGMLVFAPEQRDMPMAANMELESALTAARNAFHAGNLDEAEARYRAILAVVDHPDAIGELGNVFFARGQFNDANDAYLHAAQGLIAQNRLSQAQHVIGVLMNVQPEYAQQAIQAFNAKLQSQR